MVVVVVVVVEVGSSSSSSSSSSKYSVKRQTFLNQINRIISDFEKKSSLESIKLTMNSNNYHVNK